MQETLAGTLRLHQAGEIPFGRTIIVYLPPGYADSGPRFPVLYLQDGQNLFDPATAFLGNAWGLQAVTDELIMTGQIEPLIITGIYNAGEKRIDDYTPFRDRRGNGGGARAYGALLAKQVKPFIDDHYRTLPAASDTGLGGSSLGGLVTLYLGLRYSATYGKLIVMSPSIWWASRAILRPVSKLRTKLPLKIWLDTGTCEGQSPESCVRNSRELANLLEGKGWQPGQDLAYVEDEGAGHDEKAWANRMRGALTFLFPPKRR